jgi:hypothetical protein
MIRAAKPKPTVRSSSEPRESGILPTSSSPVPPPLPRSSVPPPLPDDDPDVIELTEDDLIEIVPPPLPSRALRN